MKQVFLIQSLSFLLLSFLPAALAAQIPVVQEGSIRHIENFPSHYVTPRNIDVWLPPGYTATKKYAVLYMQDGRSLFDSSITWNKQEWGLDETMGRLIREKRIRNCIVVGIWNAEQYRHNEYLPQKPFEMLTPEEQDTILTARRSRGQPVFGARDIRSDNYLRFLVKELKPYIDSSFSTYRDMRNTFIGGSSMGALLALYALCEFPEVFRGAACLSTHWPGIFGTTNNPFPAAMMRYLEERLPAPGIHRIYTDRGTATTDTLYPVYAVQAGQLLHKKGYDSLSWWNITFKGADHSENAWRKRLAVPLGFLLAPDRFGK